MSKNILSLNYNQAKDFFLKTESYSNIDLPSYINFQSLLLSLSKKIENKNYSDFQINRPNDYENINYKLFHNKNGKYDWRPFELIHPLLYVALVHEITEVNNWELIKKVFNDVKTDSIVECVSLPIISENQKSDKAEQVLYWWEEMEQKSLELSLDFNYIYHTDITNCYASIYTHSISWAIHTKEVSKDKNRAKGLIGDVIDMYIQKMSFNQTNGIPQGSVLMDFIAEIVLNYVDKLLTDKIKELSFIKKDDFKILRYRDDYKIFVNNPVVADSIIKSLTEVLISLGLKLHSQKTVSSNNVIQSSVKSDKINWLMIAEKGKTIQKRLLILHKFSSEYSNSGTLLKELEIIHKEIYEDTKNEKKLKFFIKRENILVLISIVVDIAYNNPRTYPISIAILSKLFSFIEDNKRIKEIFNKIIIKFNNLPNTGIMKIWLQRAIIKLDFIQHNFDENICKLVDDKDIELWNNEWVGESIKKIFIENKIINIDVINSIDDIITKDEVSLFKKNDYQY